MQEVPRHASQVAIVRRVQHAHAPEYTQPGQNNITLIEYIVQAFASNTLK